MFDTQIETSEPLNIFDLLDEKPEEIKKEVKTQNTEKAELTIPQGDCDKVVEPFNPVTGEKYKGKQAGQLLELVIELSLCGEFAGFKQWKEQGRSVMKGQKAIKILMPFTKDGETKFFSRAIFAKEQTQVIEEA